MTEANFAGVPEIRHRQWLNRAIPEALRLLRMLESRRIPERLEGWMLVTMCFRLLRTLYTTDLAVAEALRRKAVDTGIWSKESAMLLEGTPESCLCLSYFERTGKHAEGCPLHQPAGSAD